MSLVVGATRLVADADNLYLAQPQDQQHGNVLQIAKADGAITTIATDQPHLGSLAIDASHVFWTFMDSTFTQVLVQAPIGGGATTILATGPVLGVIPDPFVPRTVAVDTTNVYWSIGPTSKEPTRLMKVSLATGASTTVTRLGREPDEYGPGLFTVANGQAFYADWYRSEVERVSVDDGARSTIAVLPPSEASTFVAMTSDGQRLFWTDGRVISASA